MRWLRRRGPHSNRVPQPEEVSAREPDVDLWDDVSFIEAGRTRYGTVTAIRGEMLEVTRRDGQPPTWIDWREVDVL